MLRDYILLLCALAVAVPARAADPVFNDEPPAARSPAPKKRPVERKRKPPVKPVTKPKPAPEEEATESEDSDDAPASPQPVAALPAPAPVFTPAPPPTRLPRPVAPPPPSVKQLLGHWVMSCGGGRRRGTLDLVSIRADGKAAGSFAVAANGMNGAFSGRAECSIHDGRVDMILRWSLLFVHGRLEATAPVEQMSRTPIHFEGHWQGTNLEGLTDDFEATRIGD